MITYRGVVYPWHCDHMGHMNIMWYTGKFDEAAWNFFASIGITASYIREQKRGMAAVEMNIQYKKELVAGDVVIIQTQLLEIREKVLRFKNELINVEKNDVAAIGEFTGVHIDLVARKAVPFSQDIVDRAKNI